MIALVTALRQRDGPNIFEQLAATRRNLFSAREIAANEPRAICLDFIHGVQQLGGSQGHFDPLRSAEIFSMHDVGARPRQFHSMACEIEPVAAGQHAGFNNRFVVGVAQLLHRGFDALSLLAMQFWDHASTHDLAAATHLA